MKKLLLCLLLVLCFSCDKESEIKQEIASIDTNLNIERFDKIFNEAKPEDIPKIKETFPFLFSKRFNDSVWINRMNDSLQIELRGEVDKNFNEFKDEYLEIEKLYQHLHYYDKMFKTPRLITVTNNVDYRSKVIVTDSIALIALDNYLGENHRYYVNVYDYLRQNMKSSQIVCDLANEYAIKYAFQSQRKTFLDEMIYQGKLLYFMDKVIPFKSDNEKIGYTKEQLDWAIANEQYIWRHFVENEMLFDTNPKLASRFIAPAPFSKFNLELDNESSGRTGVYIGWQIVKAYMNNNDVFFLDMMQEDSQEIFNKSKFKPKK